MQMYEVSVSVEKVITKRLFANSEEEAIREVNNYLMSSNEDFAQILDSHVELVSE